MLWKTVLKNWESGKYFTYPKKINKKFQWNTSVIKSDKSSKFKQSFRIFSFLPKEQNYKDFSKYIKKSKNKYATSFINLSKDAILVIPMPIKNKNFATLKDFMDNASETHKKEFWKYVAKEIKKFMKTNKNTYVSVSGMGVPYTHVRISKVPKYYFDKTLL